MIVKGRYLGKHLVNKFRRGCFYTLSVTLDYREVKLGWFKRKYEPVVIVSSRGRKGIRYHNVIKFALDWHLEKIKSSV